MKPRVFILGLRQGYARQENGRGDSHYPTILDRRSHGFSDAIISSLGLLGISLNGPKDTCRHNDILLSINELLERIKTDTMDEIVGQMVEYIRRFRKDYSVETIHQSLKQEGHPPKKIEEAFRLAAQPVVAPSKSPRFTHILLVIFGFLFAALAIFAGSLLLLPRKESAGASATSPATQSTDDAAPYHKVMRQDAERRLAQIADFEQRIAQKAKTPTERAALEQQLEKLRAAAAKLDANEEALRHATPY
ncbi:MAG: hypothetical protein AAB425_02485 [Bdellovibrionota bacterium]